jgi:thioredoxin-related protein
MKKYINILIVFICITASYITFGQGVNFGISPNLDSTIAIAQKENKGVLVEIYSPSCHICEAFKVTFNQKEVGDAYNANNASVKIDFASAEAKKFFVKYKLLFTSIPVLIFFDKNQILSHIAYLSENRNTAEELINIANISNSNQRVANYKNIYEAGERNPEFLKEYSIMARAQCDTLAHTQALNEYFKSQPEADLQSDLNIFMLEKGMMHSENEFFKYFINNLPKYFVKMGEKNAKDLADKTMVRTLYSGMGRAFNIAQLAGYRSQFKKLALTALEIENRLWILELKANFRESKNTEALKIIDKRMKSPKFDAKEASYICKMIPENVTNKEVLAVKNKLCK